MRVTVNIGVKNYCKWERGEHAAGSSDQAEKKIWRETGVELGWLQRNRWVTTNSQRFGGRLLHFWPLSTMNWPEACTARIHVQGKCTCMETNTQIYTHKTSTHAHTRMCTHTYTPHTQQRQAIRLHYKKGTAEAEKQVWLFDRLWLLLLQAKNGSDQNSEGEL